MFTTSYLLKNGPRRLLVKTSFTMCRCIRTACRIQLPKATPPTQPPLPACQFFPRGGASVDKQWGIFLCPEFDIPGPLLVFLCTSFLWNAHGCASSRARGPVAYAPSSRLQQMWAEQNAKIVLSQMARHMHNQTTDALKYIKLPVRRYRRFQRPITHISI